MRTKFAILLAVTVVCVSAAWAWDAEYQITNTSDSSSTAYGNGHKIVFTGTGVGHLVWVTHKKEGRTEIVYALHYKRYYPLTGWTADTVLSSLGARSNTAIPTASIALDANGKDIHVVWTGRKQIKQCYYHVYYKKCVPSVSGNGGWVGTPTDLCTNHKTYACCDPAVACATGRVVVAWREVDEDGYAIGFCEFAAGKWQPPIQLEWMEWTGDYYYRWLASISATASGDVFVSYSGAQQSGQLNHHVYVLRRVGGTWKAREDATAEFPNLNFRYADIDVNPATSNPHIVCHGSGTDQVFRIYHTYRSAGVWQTPKVIPGSGSGPDCDDILPSMFFDVDGKAHVVWYEYNSNPDIQRGIEYSLCAYEGGSWSTSWLTSVSCYALWPNVTVSSAGAGFAVWTKVGDKVGDPGSFQVWGRTLPASGFDGPTAGAVVPSREFTLGVSPNPSSRGMVVSYSLPAAANVSLKLYDISGALAKTVACGYVLPGGHAVSLSRQGLARGAYILKLESGASSLTRKFVIE